MKRSASFTKCLTSNYSPILFRVFDMMTRSSELTYQWCQVLGLSKWHAWDDEDRTINSRLNPRADAFQLYDVDLAAVTGTDIAMESTVTSSLTSMKS